MSLPRQFVEEVNNTFLSKEFIGCYTVLIFLTVLAMMVTLGVMAVLWMFGVV